MFERLRSLMPRSWFGDDSPTRDALLHGFAHAASINMNQLRYAQEQSRIKTVSGSWLDAMAADFFGNALYRLPGEQDSSFRTRIYARLFRERGTRKGVQLAVKELTGVDTRIFEPQIPTDTGAYGQVLTGYGVGGGWGSVIQPYMSFVTVNRPEVGAAPAINGWSMPGGGYSVPCAMAYADKALLKWSLSDMEVMSVIQQAKPIGTVVWVGFTGAGGTRI